MIGFTRAGFWPPVKDGGRAFGRSQSASNGRDRRLSLLNASLDVCEGVVRPDLGGVGLGRAVLPPAKGNSQGVAQGVAKQSNLTIAAGRGLYAGVA